MAYNTSYKRWHRPNTSPRAKTFQGYAKIKNKEKYVGDSNLIIYRSSWEYSFIKWCDASPSIVRWSSEPIKIPYYDRVSKLEECKKLGLNPNNPKNWVIKNYNVDFWIEIKKSDDIIEKWFIEIKPEAKLIKPKPVSKEAPLKEQRKFNREAKEYLINEAKFAALKAWAEKNKAKFYIFTENQLLKLGIIGGKFEYNPYDKNKINHD